MRRFLIIAVLVIGLDQTIGFLLHRSYLHTTSGERGGVINGALKQNPQVLVLGSSRAKHHVMPAILGARLSASVFNAGIDGHDFLYAIMLLDLWTRSHAPPKVILLHIDPYSLSYSKHELDRVNVFSGYFGESERIRNIILMRGKYEWLKYLSSSYRFNGKVLPIIKNVVKGSDDTLDGYVPLEGSLESGAIPFLHPSKHANEYSDPLWDLKLSYLIDIARYCKANGTRFILFHSPRFQEDPTALAEWWKRLAAMQLSEAGVEFLDLAEQSQYLVTDRSDLFKDRTHLNVRGAEIFSRLLADEVASRLGMVAPMH